MMVACNDVPNHAQLARFIALCLTFFVCEADRTSAQDLVESTQKAEIANLSNGEPVAARADDTRTHL